MMNLRHGLKFFYIEIILERGTELFFFFFPPVPSLIFSLKRVRERRLRKIFLRVCYLCHLVEISLHGCVLLYNKEQGRFSVPLSEWRGRFVEERKTIIIFFLHLMSYMF